MTLPNFLCIIFKKNYFPGFLHFYLVDWNIISIFAPVNQLNNYSYEQCN